MAAILSRGRVKPIAVESNLGILVVMANYAQILPWYDWESDSLIAEEAESTQQGTISRTIFPS